MSQFTGLPEEWSLKVSKTHDREYYYNKITKSSQWDVPQGTNEELLDGYLSKGLQKPTQVKARHLLVKHRDSRKPASWKNPEITITKEEAIETARKYLKQIKSGETTFEDLARTESDCSSHAKGGDLGVFKRGMMQPSFEMAAFGLQVGEITDDVIESDSGIHIIERTG